MSVTKPSIEDLLQAMTVQEKAGQLHQTFQSPTNAEEIRTGSIGSIICASGAYAGNESQARVRAQEINELQRIAATESRLGIPLLVARDVIHGHRTVAPIPLGQAASWSAPHVRVAAEVAAREAYSDGIRLAFAPMLDISRDPRWGRVAEGFGEDPWLCSSLAAAAVRGFQGENLAEPGRIAACAKHFAGYGGAEGGRDYNSAEITWPTMRNVYLPPFRAAVRAGVATVMCAFNDIGGMPATANRRLLKEILKDEWGFKGFVASDWNAVQELTEHRIAANGKGAAKLAFDAGVDVDMVSGCFRDSIPSLLTEQKIGSGQLDESVRRILTLKEHLGLFDDPYTDPSLAERWQFTTEHQEKVLELARRSLVLLKNRGGLLPIRREFKTVGLFGPLIEAKELLNGAWCLDGEARDVRTIRECLQDQLAGGQDLLASVLPDEALSLSRRCDVAITVVGEHQLRSGEANSVTRPELPPGQIEWLMALKRMGAPLVVVVLSGRPLCVPWLAENADAILWAWHPGTMGGQAIAEVLTGAVNPSGKLPVTFPRAVGQIPIYYNHKRTGRPLDPYDRRDSRYLDDLDAPLYPFGFGLSFSIFKYRNLRVTAKADGHSISCEVTNASDRAGEEVVQLYLGCRVSSLARPVKELCGSQRILLAAGAKIVAEFVLKREDFGYYGPLDTWVVEPGTFDVWIGPNSVECLAGQVDVD